MSDARRSLTVNLITLGGSNVFQRIISLVSFVYLVRYLPIADYGRLNLLISVIAPAFALVTLGLQGIVSAEIALARGREQLGAIKRLLKDYRILNTTIFIILLGGYWVLRDTALLRGWFSSEYDPYVGAVLVYLVCHIFLSYSSMLLKSFEHFTSVAMVETAEILVRFLIFVGIFFMSATSLGSIFAAYAGSKFGAACIAWWRSRSIVRQISKSEVAESDGLWSLIRGYAKWTILQGILSQFTGSIQLWLTQYFASSEAVAVYSVALKAQSYISKAFPLSNVIEPMIQRKIDDVSYVSLIIKKARKYYALYYGAAVIGILLFMKTLLGYVAPEYVPSILVFYILSFNMLSSAVSTGQIPLLFAHRKQQFRFWLFLYTLIVGSLVDALGLYYFGVVGLAVVTVLMTYSATFIKEWYLRKYLGYHLLSPRDYIHYDYYDQLVVGKVLGIFKKILPSRFISST